MTAGMAAIATYHTPPMGGRGVVRGMSAPCRVLFY